MYGVRAGRERLGRPRRMHCIAPPPPPGIDPTGGKVAKVAKVANFLGITLVAPLPPGVV
jgi:hypothetical protein